MIERGKADARWGRFAKGMVPVAIALGMLYVAGFGAGRGNAATWAALLTAAVALLSARRWIARTAMTKWAGVYLAMCTAFFIVLRAFGFAVEFRWIATPGVLLLLVGFLYDLFVWQPHKGRFARARAERRGWPE